MPKHLGNRYVQKSSAEKSSTITAIEINARWATTVVDDITHSGDYQRHHDRGDVVVVLNRIFREDRKDCQ